MFIFQNKVKSGFLYVIDILYDNDNIKTLERCFNFIKNINLNGYVNISSLLKSLMKKHNLAFFNWL